MAKCWQLQVNAAHAMIARSTAQPTLTPLGICGHSKCPTVMLAPAHPSRAYTRWAASRSHARARARTHTQTRAMPYHVRWPCMETALLLPRAGATANVHIWDLPAYFERHKLPHEGTVNALAFTVDGTVLASGGMDKYVRVWDIATGQQLHALLHEEYVLALAFAPAVRRRKTHALLSSSSLSFLHLHAHPPPVPSLPSPRHPTLASPPLSRLPFLAVTPSPRLPRLASLASLASPPSPRLPRLPRLASPRLASLASPPLASPPSPRLPSPRLPRLASPRLASRAFTPHVHNLMHLADAPE